MSARAYRLDVESQIESTNREESRDAARFDKRDLTRVGGLRYETDRLPDPRDVDDL